MLLVGSYAIAPKTLKQLTNKEKNMLTCFICSLLKKPSLAQFTAVIEHTIHTMEDVKKSVLTKTFLFGWIKIFEDKIVKNTYESERTSRFPVCCDHKKVTHLSTYEGNCHYGKKPQIIKTRGCSHLGNEIKRIENRIKYKFNLKDEEIRNMLETNNKEQYKEVFDFKHFQKIKG